MDPAAMTYVMTWALTGSSHMHTCQESPQVSTLSPNSESSRYLRSERHLIEVHSIRKSASQPQ